MKKIVAFEEKDWKGLVLDLAAKKIAWQTVSKWYYAAIGAAFAFGVLAGYLIKAAEKVS